MGLTRSVGFFAISFLNSVGNLSAQWSETWRPPCPSKMQKRPQLGSPPILSRTQCATKYYELEILKLTVFHLGTITLVLVFSVSPFFTTWGVWFIFAWLLVEWLLCAKAKNGFFIFALRRNSSCRHLWIVNGWKCTTRCEDWSSLSTTECRVLTWRSYNSTKCWLLITCRSGTGISKGWLTFSTRRFVLSTTLMCFTTNWLLLITKCFSSWSKWFASLLSWTSPIDSRLEHVCVILLELLLLLLIWRSIRSILPE